MSLLDADLRGQGRRCVSGAHVVECNERRRRRGIYDGRSEIFSFHLPFTHVADASVGATRVRAAAVLM